MSPTIPPDFNWKEYRDLHSELSEFTEIQCIRHYLYYGAKNGWQYRRAESLTQRGKIDYQLYSKYIGIDMPIHHYQRMYEEEPVYLVEHDGKLYHVEINFFITFYQAEVDKKKYPTCIDYVRKNYVIICQQKKCCPRCRFPSLDFNTVYQLSTMANVNLSTMAKIRVKQLRRTQFTLVHVLNVGTCKKELIEYLLTRIYDVIKRDELLFISTNEMVPSESLDYLKTNVKHDNLIWIDVPNQGLDIGQYFITISLLNSLRINYEYLVRTHTKRNRKWLDSLIIPLIGDRPTLERFIDSMRTHDIHYNGATDRLLTLDCNCFKFIGVKFPGIYHHHNVRFIAGTIFVSTKKFNDTVLEILSPGSYYLFTDQYTPNDKCHELSYPHVVERSLGIINYLNFCKNNLVIIATSLSTESKLKMAENNLKVMLRGGVAHIVVLLDDSGKFNSQLSKFKRPSVSYLTVRGCKNEFQMWNWFFRTQYQSFTNYRKYTFCTDDITIPDSIDDFLNSDETYALYTIRPTHHLFTVGKIEHFIAYLAKADSSPLDELRLGLYQHFNPFKNGSYGDDNYITITKEENTV